MKTLTAQVRKILRETMDVDSRDIWTNRYKNCRTVKTYEPADEELIIDAAVKIEKFCKKNGIPFEMKVVKRFENLGRSVIVRLPLND